jgi:hypothetical protein
LFSANRGEDIFERRDAGKMASHANLEEVVT